jgi:small-conductance mechanosensitive channel
MFLFVLLCILCVAMMAIFGFAIGGLMWLIHVYMRGYSSTAKFGVLGLFVAAYILLWAWLVSIALERGMAIL